MGGVAAGAALAAAPSFAQTGASRFLSSDIGALKTVLVHSIVPQDDGFDRLSENAVPGLESDMEVATEQQAGLIRLLKAQGAQTIEVADALAGAIAATRRSGIFETWLRTAFPGLGLDADRVTAATILGRDPAIRNRLRDDGDYRHYADTTLSTMWTRDSAFMAPAGLVMCRSASGRRRRENMLLRFCYAHSPLLKDYPIAFDALSEGISIEGGDAMFVRPDLLLLGTGNRTDPRMGPLLAKRLDCDVLTVQTYSQDFIRPDRPGLEFPVQQLRVLLLHLDTYFTQVAPGHALCVPWLLEQAHAETNPLSRFVRGARTQGMIDPEDAEKSLEMLKEFGRVKLWKRGSGTPEDLGEMKLVDYLRTQGWKFTFVGGASPEGDQAVFAHFMATVYPELRRQAANVVQARPGRVIAYAGNPMTKAALEKDGLIVDTFPARELWAWHGGPHCLTQPLLRA
ncbi:arginine deiminase [Polymorphobacter multimanifer]|nr:arginine deiminase [Polymorphobacter multimanifer]